LAESNKGHLSKETKEKLSISSRKMWEDPDFKQKMSKKIKEACSTDEVRNKRSAIAKALWNDPDYRERQMKIILERTSDPEYKKKCSNTHKERCSNPEVRKKMSDSAKKSSARPEIKEIQSINMKKRWTDPEYKEQMSGVNAPNYGRQISDDQKLKISQANTGKQRSPEMIERMKIINKGKWAGEKNPHYGKPPAHGKGEWFVLPNGSKIWLRSSYEVRVVVALLESDVKFEYEPRNFSLNNGTTYTPDFYLPEYDIWWEVKGYWRDDAKEKIGKFFEKYPEENLRILYEQDLIELEERLKNEDVDFINIGKSKEEF